MCRRGSGLIITGAVLVSGALAGPTSAVATPALTVLDANEHVQSIALDRNKEKQLVGKLDLVVRNETDSAGSVVARYLPTGEGNGTGTAAVTLVPGQRPIAPHQLDEVELTAQLGAEDSPSDLHGLLQLLLVGKQGPIQESAQLAVKGAGPELAGISIVPATVTLHPISWGGPFSQPESDGTSVQLRGPGLQALFRNSAEVAVQVKLQSSTGHQVDALLKARAPQAGSSVSTADVEVKGTLSPGSYSTKLPLSDLTSGTPALELKVDASHSFLWALLAVSLGAFAGGGIYLASNLRRRKSILEAAVREMLAAYVRLRGRLRRSGAAMPLWEIGGLGPQADWYKRAWSALSESDGVQGIWSKIYWARNDADLDDVQALVSTLRERISRWLKFTREGDLEALLAAAEAKPSNPSDAVWAKTKTAGDTRRLLLELREVEPTSEAAAEDLLGRTIRQARWHAALAFAWHMKSVVMAEVAARPDDDDAREKLGAIDLVDLDDKSSPESTRMADKQLDLELKLEEWTRELEKMHLGAPEAMLVPGPQLAVMLGGLSAQEARPAQDARVNLVGVVPSSPPTGDARPSHSSSRAIAQDWVKMHPGWLKALLLRDYLWSLVIVVITAAAYVPTLYNSTWGSLGDYGSAFVAGFVGKAVINWAILPLFGSLSVKRQTANGGAQSGSQQSGASGAQAPNVSDSPQTPAAQQTPASQQAPV